MEILPKQDLRSKRFIMKQSEMIAKLWEMYGEKLNLSKKAVGEMVESFVGMMVNSLKAGIDVKIPALGVLRKKITKARTAINPRTKEQVQVPSKKVVRFRASKALKEIVN